MKPRSARWLALLLLALLYGQLLSAATRLSATIDEPFHITSGYEYLRTGKLQLFDEHAPLAKALFAWPLFFVPDLLAPETASDYANGDLVAVTQETLLAYRPLDRVIVAPRVAAALLTVLLAATVFRCATSFGGPTAGLLALTLCAFDPNFLAHGSLATTDMGATAFIFWALWAGTRWLKRPTRRRWLLAALLLGLAQGAKLTTLLVYPVLGLGVLFNAEAQRRRGAEYPIKMLLAFTGMVGVSLLVLWAIYGFELRAVAGILGGAIPLPAASHIERWLRLQANLAYGREAFLLGQNGMHGWTLYFPVAFLIKTPLPMLLLGLFCILHTAYCVLRNFLTHQRHALRITHYALRISFYLFPLLYALASLASPLNIGYRHLLPILPFLYIGVASCGFRVASCELKVASCGSKNALHFTDYALRITQYASRITHHASRITHYALLAWLALGTLHIAPHHLTFFNELAGGPENGWRFLADSNTDWGQAYKALADYQEARGIERLQVAGFVFYDPAAYGVRYTPLTPLGGNTPPIFPARFAPPPGDYAISVTALDGVPLADPEMYDWFRRREPDARIANAIFYYHVPPTEAVQWVAQCRVPVIPLNDDELTFGFGTLPARRLNFDCTQVWLAPPDGTGVYVLHGEHVRDTLQAQLLLEAPPPQDSFIARRLATATLRYRQRRTQAIPPFLLYTAGEASPTPEALRTVAWIAPAETTPQALEATPLLQGPYEFADGLTLLGAAVYPQPHGLEVETWWRVRVGPQSRPLSLMAHLVDVQGVTLGIADGLGIPPDAWQEGDLFIQRHRFTLQPSDAAGPLFLRAGVYWLDDGARWNVTSKGTTADAVFIPLTATPTP